MTSIAEEFFLKISNPKCEYLSPFRPKIEVVFCANACSDYGMRKKSDMQFFLDKNKEITN